MRRPLSQNKVLGLVVIPIAVGLVTALGVSLGRPVGSLSHIFLYLLVVTVAAFWWGVWLAVYAFMLSCLAIFYFFVPPRGSFKLNLDGDYPYTSEFLGMSVFLVLSLFMVYLLTALQKERDRAHALAQSERQAKETVVRASRELEQQQRRTTFLQHARQRLGDTIEPEKVLQTVLDELVQTLGGKVMLTLQDGQTNPEKEEESEAGQEVTLANSPKIWRSGYSPQEPLPLAKESSKEKSDLIIPLRTGGQLLGWLAYSSAPTIASNGLKETELQEKEEENVNATVQMLAEYIAVSLENAKLYQTVEFQSNEIAQLLKGSLRADTALSKRADQLSIFYRLSAAVISGIDKRRLMALGLGEAARVLRGSVGAVLLLNENQQLELVARRGAIRVKEGSLIALEGTLPGKVLQSRQPFLTNRYNPVAAHLPRPVLDSSPLTIQACLYVPIQSETELFGLIMVGMEEAGSYSQDDQEFLVGLASLLALALVSSQYYEQRERSSILEERNRIARDLHDGLAQSINYIGLKTQLIQELYQTGEYEQIEQEVARIAKASERARTDVREALYGLRHTERDQSLVVGLANLVRGIGDLGQIKIELITDEKVDWPILSITTQIQLMRIVQEALSNVQKHSQAKQAQVEACYYPDKKLICLIVRDNGIGFQPEQVKSSGGQHLGLGIMRERAARLGADLQFKSQPGQGTELVLEYYIEQTEPEKNQLTNHRDEQPQPTQEKIISHAKR